MKKKLIILTSILILAIIGTALTGLSFFNVRFNFYNSSHAVYTKTDNFSAESKIKGTTLSKLENGIWVSEPVYFENTHQLHFAMIKKEADDMFRIKAVLTSESDKSIYRDFNIFAGPGFFMFKSYRVYFDFPELVQGQKYKLQIKKIGENKQDSEKTLGELVFSIK